MKHHAVGRATKFLPDRHVITLLIDYRLQGGVLVGSPVPPTEGSLTLRLAAAARASHRSLMVGSLFYSAFSIAHLQIVVNNLCITEVRCLALY